MIHNQPHGSACTARPEARNLTPRGWTRVRRLFGRGVLLRCPQCGGRGIFAHPWSIRECCPSCGYAFTSEDGYFLGAYALNLVVAEVLGLGTVLVFLLRSDLSVMWQQIIAIAAAILLPVLFYPWSRTLWMAIDLSSGGDNGTDHLRADQMGGHQGS